MTVIALLFVLGTFIGSFIATIVYRLPESLPLKEKSYCENCKKRLTFLELIPLFSYIKQKGKCPSCKKSFSIINPFMEIGCGLILSICYYVVVIIDYNAVVSPYNDFVAFLEYRYYYSFVITSCISITLLALSVTDARYHAVPVSILGFYCAFVVLYNLEIANFVISATIIFALVKVYSAVRKKNVMGLGDIPVIASMISLFGLFYGMVCFFISMILAAAYILYKKARKDYLTSVPLIPFFAIAMFISIILKRYDVLYLQEKAFEFLVG